MDAGSMTETTEDPGARPWPHWKLQPEIAPLAQGLVVSGFGRLPTGRALFLEIAEGRPGGAWLRALEQAAPVTAADRNQGSAVALAFTWTGLGRIGLPETTLASFSRPFREGMFQEDRLRRLGDRRGGVWQQTTGGEPPLWSANTPLRPATGGIGAYDVDYSEPEEFVGTALTVHAVLLLYTRDEAEAAALENQAEAALAPHGVRIVHRRELVLDIEKQRGYSREHFGFADGLSQPEPYDEEGAVMVMGAPVREPDPVQGVPLGEFLIGYLNGHHEKAPGPVVPGVRDDGTEDERPAAAGLVPHREAEGFYDFGLNGSYMVVRELQQDVAAFWKSMDANTEAIRKSDPVHSGHVNSTWLAERVVGRDRDGNLLCPGGVLPLDSYGNPENKFLFLERDPHGVGCPPGSHVRRANPRDALAPTLAQGIGLLGAANNHRVLRRGRKYGPKIHNEREDDRTDRGLLFMCLNTDIARQFEFVQQTWLLNSDFATLFDEVDPLVGPDGRMTIREEPLRRTVHVRTFVRMRGGEYFFLPSLPALQYLAAL
jgi:Dyp-type peroxidase family